MSNEWKKKNEKGINDDLKKDEPTPAHTPHHIPLGGIFNPLGRKKTL